MISNGDWLEAALCAQTDPDLMFPDTNTANRAKRVCNFCEVQTECLADALSEQVQYGIRGGLSAFDRQKMRAQMNRQNADLTGDFARLVTAKKKARNAQTSEPSATPSPTKATGATA